MAVSRGKQFEKVVERDIKKIPNTLCERLHDVTSGYVNLNTPADYIVYKDPNFYFVECKTIHGASLPLTNLVQLDRIIKRITGVSGAFGYFIVWFVDKAITVVLSVDFLDKYRNKDESLLPYLPNQKFKNSLNYMDLLYVAQRGFGVYVPPQEYKRVFGTYDFSRIFGGYTK